MGRRDYRDPAGEKVPSVTDILGKFLGTDMGRWANTLGFAKLDYTNELNYRAAVGTMTHCLVERHFGLESPWEEAHRSEVERTGRTWDNAIAEVEDCRDRLLMWWEDQELTDYKVELQGVHSTLLYGGTMDMVALTTGEDAGEVVIIDWKTSGAIRQKHRIQIAAYIDLWNSQPGLPPEMVCKRGYAVCAPYERRFKVETGEANIQVSEVKGKYLERYLNVFGFMRMAHMAMYEDERFEAFQKALQQATQGVEK